MDRIICNGAFWLINKPETLKAMANILKDDGKLVFNMPGQIFKFDEKNKQKLILSSLFSNYDGDCRKEIRARL